MGHTFGDRFREHDLAAQRRLMQRFRAVAMTLCEQYGFYDSEADDLVQEAFKAIIPKEYEFQVDTGPVTFIWKVIERKIIDERRRRRPTFEHEIRPQRPMKLTTGTYRLSMPRTPRRTRSRTSLPVRPCWHLSRKQSGRSRALNPFCAFVAVIFACAQKSYLIRFARTPASTSMLTDKVSVSGNSRLI